MDLMLLLASMLLPVLLWAAWPEGVLLRIWLRLGIAYYLARKVATGQPYEPEWLGIGIMVWGLAVVFWSVIQVSIMDWRERRAAPIEVRQRREALFWTLVLVPAMFCHTWLSGRDRDR